LNIPTNRNPTHSKLDTTARLTDDEVDYWLGRLNHPTARESSGWDDEIE
jgi:hypothetical protein